MAMLSAKAQEQHEARNKAIRRGYYEEGRTSTDLADEYEMTPQRVSQIIQPRPDFYRCRSCGGTFPLKARGRPPKFHSAACKRQSQTEERQRSWDSVL